MSIGPISASRLSDMFKECLATEFDVEPVIVSGLVNTVAFDEGRLKSHKDEIVNMLNHLPDEFKLTGGGGYSFLQMPFDRYGQQWGEQRNAEQLLLMALALDLASYCLPREYWSALPGGVPYVVIK